MIPVIIALSILSIFCIIDILVLEKKVKGLSDWIETLRDENSNQWIHLQGNTESIGNILKMMQEDLKFQKLQIETDKITAEGFGQIEERFQKIENEIDRMKPKEVPKCLK